MTDALRFREDGTFTVLQMSDVQDLVWLRPAMKRMMERACDAVRPDLILYTGDNWLGNHVQDRRFFGKHHYDEDQQFDVIRRTLQKVFDIPEKRGIPFAVIFGNHDDRNDVSKDRQSGVWRAYACNRGSETTGELVGNYTLPVYGADGKVRLAIHMLDTARYDKAENKCYETVTAEQVAWYRAEAKKYRDADRMIFMHVPMREVCAFQEETDASGGVRGSGGRYFRLNAALAEGVLGEEVSPVSEENGLFDAIRQSGNVLAVVSGHDHVNDFEGVYEGVRFIASPGCSFRSYGSDVRGMPVFTFDEKKPGTFGKRIVRWPELCGTGPEARLRYLLDADEKVPQKIALLGSAAAIGAAVPGLAVAALVKKHRA